ERLLTKPPGMYIAIVLCSLPVGQVTDWTARLPAALAATGSVLLLGWYVRRQLGTMAGVLAVLLTPLSLAWLDKATAAEIDMLLVFWVVASIVCFLRGMECVEETDQQDPSPPLTWFALAYLSLALGFLTKWTSPIFFFGTLLPFLYWRGQLRLLIRPIHLVSVVPAVAVIGAWVWLTADRVGWETLYTQVSQEWLGHVRPSHHHRSYPWGESLIYPCRVWLAALPVSVFALFAFKLNPNQLAAGEARMRQVYLCWLVFPLLFWTIFPDHDVRQSLSLFPAIGGLATLTWRRWLAPAHARRLWSPSVALVALIVSWLIVKLAFVHVVMPIRTHERQPRLKGELLARHVPAGATLYLDRLKDDGLLFYYGRPTERRANLTQLTFPSRPIYAILTEHEYRQRSATCQLVIWLHDQQGEPIVLVRLEG
ncbi:MAG: ArnT family glycosyltransferase, partial [Gemmataceae bacterium]